MKNDKIRPVQERLGQLEGMTTFKDLREGVGGFAHITQQDLNTALAILRTLRVADCRDDGLAELADVILGPEVLQTYFGSTQRYRRVIVEGYMQCNRVEAKLVVAHRMGATLAAQMLAGIRFFSDQEAEFAWICNTRLQMVRQLRDHALSWFSAIVDDAIVPFGAVVRGVIETRMQERGEKFLRASVENDVRKAKKREEAAKKAAAAA